MATSLGKAGYLLLSAVTALELRNYALDRTSDTTEDTVIGDLWKTRKATLNDWSVSADMFWDPLDPGQSAAATGIEAGTAITVNLYPSGAGSAATYYTGLAIVTSLGASAAHDGMVERSFACEGTGALTTATV
jgi:predicted secreted protein